MRSCRALLAICLVFTGVAAAQDAHYWNKQYGNRAYLLGGAVIGSSNDCLLYTSDAADDNRLV